MREINKTFTQGMEVNDSRRKKIIYNSSISYKYRTLYLSMEKQWNNKMTDKDI